MGCVDPELFESFIFYFLLMQFSICPALLKYSIKFKHISQEC